VARLPLHWRQIANVYLDALFYIVVVLVGIASVVGLVGSLLHPRVDLFDRLAFFGSIFIACAIATRSIVRWRLRKGAIRHGIYHETLSEALARAPRATQRKVGLGGYLLIIALLIGFIMLMLMIITSRKRVTTTLPELGVPTLAASAHDRLWHKASDAKALNLRQLLGEQRECMDRRPRLPSTRMTPSRHRPDPNPAVQRAPDLILANALSCPQDSLLGDSGCTSVD
jgi:hypothetical protein